MLYPIVREALANSLKHARASQITVVAERVESGLAVVVADNGSGMLRTVSADGLGQGTVGIRERAAAIGRAVHAAGWLSRDAAAGAAGLRRSAAGPAIRIARDEHWIKTRGAGGYQPGSVAPPDAQVGNHALQP